MSDQASSTWKKLEDLAQAADSMKIPEFMNADRVDRYSAAIAGIHVDFSKHLVSDEVFRCLLQLADDARITDHARRMYAGEPVNTTESRAALHMSMRKPSTSLPEEIRAGLDSDLEQMKQISEQVRTGAWTGSTGSAITDVINIGIGGSDLGPKMAVAALREYVDGPRCHFISNVDGAEILTLLKDLDAASTLVLISSKSFTTSETLINAKTAMAWLGQNLGIDDPESSRHCIGITASTENARRFGLPIENIVHFPESIGGRYSLWSNIGLPVSIAIGFDKFAEMLAGGARMDEHFLTAPPERNIPVILALLGIWYTNFLKAQSHAVIPYCQRLRLFVDHLQQLDMESNGKSTKLDGNPVEGHTGPILWGQTGTNGQHAFFQLLHQGTHLVPVDFIGVVNDHLSNQDHHRVLLANMVAQSEALMVGRSSDDPHRNHPGNRPSTTILLDEVSPASLGALLTAYEQKVFAQSVIWRVNPFDQWGVELGKVLAESILEGSHDHDPSTLGLMKKTGLIE